MRLLSQQEVTEKKAADFKSKAKILKELAAEEVRLVKAVSTLTDDLKKMENDYSNKAEGAKKKYNKTIEALKNEIAILENKRLAALEPIDNERNKLAKEKAELDEREAELQAYWDDVKAREAELDALAEALADEGDSVSEREEVIAQKEAGIKAEKERLKKSQEALALDWAEYYRVSKEADVDIRAKSREIKERLATIAAKNEILNKREEELDIEAKKIADKRATLDRAIEEYKRKGVKI